MLLNLARTSIHVEDSENTENHYTVENELSRWLETQEAVKSGKNVGAVVKKDMHYPERWHTTDRMKGHVAGSISRDSVLSMNPDVDWHDEELRLVEYLGKRQNAVVSREEVVRVFFPILIMGIGIPEERAPPMAAIRDFFFLLAKAFLPANTSKEIKNACSNWVYIDSPFENDERIVVGMTDLDKDYSMNGFILLTSLLATSMDNYGPDATFQILESNIRRAGYTYRMCEIEDRNTHWLCCFYPTWIFPLVCLTGIGVVAWRIVVNWADLEIKLVVGIILYALFCSSFLMFLKTPALNIESKYSIPFNNLTFDAVLYFSGSMNSVMSCLSCFTFLLTFGWVFFMWCHGNEDWLLLAVMACGMLAGIIAWLLSRSIPRKLRNFLNVSFFALLTAVPVLLIREYVDTSPLWIRWGISGIGILSFICFLPSLWSCALEWDQSGRIVSLTQWCGIFLWYLVIALIPVLIIH